MSAVLGSSVVVTAVTRVGEEFGFAGESYRVELAHGDAPPSVIVKLWALRDAEDDCELRFYRELAGATPIRLPEFHGGGVDTTAGRGWLVLEELHEFRQGDGLVDEPVGVIVRLVQTMAKAQAAWWGRLEDRAWLPMAPRFRRDSEYLATRRSEYLERFGPLPESAAARMFDEIPALVSLADDLLDGAPATLLHMDVGLDNVLFLQPDDEPVLVDWARCGRGPGVHDLSSILLESAPLDRFGEVVEAYIDALHDAGVRTPVEHQRRWLNGALIHAFVTMTLGVARWAAETSRGLQLLDQLVARTPHAVAAWRRFDPTVAGAIG